MKRTVKFNREQHRWIAGDQIAFGERTWDGIDRPDYTDFFKLTPDEARYIATELWKLAEDIDGKQEKASKLKLIRENTDNIIKEAKAMEGL